MIRKHDQAPETPETILRRRLDGVDKRLAQLDGLATDVNALGHGFAELTHRVTVLSDAAARGTGAASTRSGQGSDGDATSEADPAGGDTAGEDADDGQPDWLTVTDPDLATAWLTDALAFAGDVLAQFPRGKLPDCWPVHGVAVVEVLALQRQWADAYATPDPGAVSDLLGRWLPGALHRLGRITGECGLQRAHQEDNHHYRVPALEPDRVALWWIDSRGLDPTATVAFAMTRLS